jgi:hypothetical protein
VIVPFKDAFDKAKHDPFEYLLRLKSGEVIHFHSLEWNKGDTHVHLCEPSIMFPKELCHCRFERGMDVRFDQIVWISDDGYIDGI